MRINLPINGGTIDRICTHAEAGVIGHYILHAVFSTTKIMREKTGPRPFSVDFHSLIVTLHGNLFEIDETFNNAQLLILHF